MQAAEDFEAWVAEMPDALERLFAELPPSLASELVYTPRSLLALEAWLLSQYQTIEAFRSERTVVVDGCARYIGQSFNAALGSHWHIDLKNKKNPFFSMPVITGGRAGSSPLCPHFLATASLDRRVGRFMYEILTRLEAGAVL